MCNALMEFTAFVMGHFFISSLLNPFNFHGRGPVSTLVLGKAGLVVGIDFSLRLAHPLRSLWKHLRPC